MVTYRRTSGISGSSKERSVDGMVLVERLFCEGRPWRSYRMGCSTGARSERW